MGSICWGQTLDAVDEIYTKVGDGGSTHLANGQKVKKTSLRIAAYGDVDELNALLGLLLAHLADDAALTGYLPSIQGVQNDLFDIGGELATPMDSLNLDRQQVVSKQSIQKLEQYIDAMNADLAPLENFVLPGGSHANALAHVARTVCRRAERSIVAMQAEETVRPEVMQYVNRLSDWLFVLSRSIAKSQEIDEVLWNQDRS